VARDLERFFGGSASTTAAARAASDPFAYAKGSKIPIRLVVGTADGTVGPSPTIKLNTWLAKRGWNVVLTLVPGGTHMSILWSSYKGGSFGAVFSAIAAARSKG
jgi:pimeloyl-ACP methyl ester carboxylesterase